MATFITIELFSASACNRCGDAKKRLKALVEEMGEDKIHYREVDVLEELDYVVSLGVLTTPAFAIDGELVFSGMPSMKRLRNELQSRLTTL